MDKDVKVKAIQEKIEMLHESELDELIEKLQITDTDFNVAKILVENIKSYWRNFT